MSEEFHPTPSVAVAEKAPAEHAATVVPAFDFEGLVIPSIERFHCGFGGRPTQYLEISKVGRWLEPVPAVRRSLRRRGPGR